MVGRSADLGLLILRVGTGGILAAHGYTKLFGGKGKTPHPILTRVYGKNFPQAVEQGGPRAFARVLDRLETPAPGTSAYLSGIAEFGGGLAIAFGLLTGVAAPVIIGNLAVAIRKVHWQNGLYGEGGFEFPLSLAIGATTILLAGPGKYSLDALFQSANAAEATESVMT